VSDLKERYEEVIRELAGSYEARGYAVQVNAKVGPPSAKLKADLLAKRGGETVLVEVKLATSGAPSDALRQYAELARQEGWRFVIAIADSKNVETVEIPSVDEVRAKIVEAKKIKPKSDAASLMAWAVLEAAARFALARSGHRVVRSKPPTALVQELAGLGRLSTKEERELLAFAAKRNRLAHGFWDATVAPIEVGRVLALAERLLTDNE
jgi:Holliday junction resolvase